MAKFDLPVEDFIVAKLKENFPNFDLRETTAFRDMLIKPMVLLIQPLRDQTNIIKRNLSLDNFPLMLEDEFDALVSNVFVTRRSGDLAKGSIRVFFEAPRDVIITSDVTFLTEDGVAFVAEEAVVITSEEMRQNVEGLFFFVDVPVIADTAGISGSVAENTVVFAEGAPDGVVQVNNPNALTGGIDPETNTQLFARAQTSITVRDLVTEKSILAVVLEQFNSVREAIVIGFDDAEMLRDITPILVDLSEVIGTETTGSTAIGPTFTDVTQDFVTSLVALGHELIILSGADIGTFIVTGFTATTLTVTPSFTASASGLSYRIDGFAVKEDLHIGGKVDVYSDTTTLRQTQAIIDPTELVGSEGLVKVNRAISDGTVAAGGDALTVIDFDFLDALVVDTDKIEILEGANKGIFDIQSGTVTRKTVDLAQGVAVASFTADDNIRFRIIRHYYDSAVIFDLPVIRATRVIRLDPITFEETGAPLVEGSDFFIRVNDDGSRFSSLENIEFVFEHPTFTGTVMKIEYTTDDTISSIQAFMDADENRVVTASILSKHALPAFVDMNISYKGTPEPETLEPIVRDFIDTIAFGETLQQSDIVALLYSFSVNFVMISFTMTAKLHNVDGTIDTLTSIDEITIPRTAHFIAENVTLTKLGA